MIYTFGDFQLDEERYELRRAGTPIRLEPKAFRILAYLIQHRDRVVTRDELLEQFWPGEFVTASAPAHCIVQARQAVGDAGVAQRVIKTVHGHGYRFIAAVVTRQSEAAMPAVPAMLRPSTAAAGPPPPAMPVPLDCQPQISQRIPVDERKQATVLAVGVKGIPALAQALDPEVLPAVLRRLFDLMRIEVERVEGRVSLVTGDGLRALFGAPIAHEEHAVRALHAALGVQRAFAVYAEDLRRMQGITLTLRIGLHAGPVVVATIDSAEHKDAAAQGFTSYLADGLQQLASEGAIYVSAAVWRHTEGFFQFKALGMCALSDIAQPVRVYVCTGMNQMHTRLEASLRRHRSAFLGREREIDLLHALWTRTRGGQGQVVCLFGAAGVSKSRLAYLLASTLCTRSWPRASRCCHTYSASLRTPSRFPPCLLRYGNGACSRHVSR